MAKNLLDKENEKAKRGRGRPRKEARAAEAKEEAEDKQGSPGEQNEDGNGKKPKKVRKALRKAVKEEIRLQRKKIATALVKKVAEGDKRCTEMMFSLIEKKKKGDNGASRHGGMTTADLLGSEEQWEDESAEAMERKAEQGRDGKETAQGT